MTSHVSDKAPVVLVTGAGGAAVPSLIEGLRARRYRVVAVDADANAAGLYLADAGYRIPFASAVAFPDALAHICRLEGVAVLVPLVDEELLPVASLADQLHIPVVAPRSSFTALCLDKYALMKRLKEVGIDVPESWLLRDRHDGMPFPLILKPRVGRGSRGVRVIATPAELDAYISTNRPDVDAMLLQRYVEGTEFTVSVVAWRDGVVRAVVPKEIIDKRGITRIAVTRRQPQIDGLCRAIQDELRADGPFNVQLRVDIRDGRPLPFEINPRFSTTTTLTQAAGVDELGRLVDLAIGVSSASEVWTWREDVTLVRRTVDAFLTFNDFATRRRAVQKSR